MNLVSSTGDMRALKRTELKESKFLVSHYSRGNFHGLPTLDLRRDMNTWLLEGLAAAIKYIFTSPQKCTRAACVLVFQHYWRCIIRVAKKISVKESKTRI